MRYLHILGNLGIAIKREDEEKGYNASVIKYYDTYLITTQITDRFLPSILLNDLAGVAINGPKQ